MSFRVMFDSIDPSAIPADADIVGGYIDGPASQWPSVGWTMFPHAALVRINVTGDPSHGGDELDVERFDATPDHAPVWFDERTAELAKQGIRGGLSIYCGRDTLREVVAKMGQRSYFRRVATLDGTLHIDGYKPMEGPAAIQFASAAMLGINADMSLVMSDYYHPTPVKPASRSVADLFVSLANTQSELGQLRALLDKYGSVAGQ